MCWILFTNFNIYLLKNNSINVEKRRKIEIHALAQQSAMLNLSRDSLNGRASNRIGPKRSIESDRHGQDSSLSLLVLSTCMSVGLSIYLSICLIGLSLSFSLSLSTCMSVGLSIYLSFCLSVSNVVLQPAYPSIRSYSAGPQYFLQDCMCTQQRLNSVWIHAVWSKPSQGTQWVAEDPKRLQANSKDYD